MGWLWVIALGWLLKGQAQDLPLLVEYPYPTEKQIPLLTSGTTLSLIAPAHFVQDQPLKIRVRMFPLLTSPYRDPYPPVRHPFEIDIQNATGVRILNLNSQEIIARGNRVHFDFSKELFIVDQKSFPLRELFIEPIDSEVFSQLTWDRGQTNGQGELVEISVLLRGSFEIRPTYFWRAVSRLRHLIQRKALWSVINVLPLNEYLQSVLPSEIPTTWPIEALKAQAVAARTYALFEIAEARIKNQRIWDVDPTTWFQSYRGVTFRKGQRAIKIEHPETNNAVRESRHKIITYKGEAIKAYFSANSGGVTCSAKECFHLEGENPPYLVSVPDAPGVQQMPYGTWGALANVTRETIKGRLLLMGYPESVEVLEMRPQTVGPSGRVWGLKVLTKDGNEIHLNRIQSSAMMTLFGPIRSFNYQLFSPDETGRQIVVGHGLGHGVGMSQYGAYLFAQSQWSYEKILTYFYQNTRLFQISSEVESQVVN